MTHSVVHLVGCLKLVIEQKNFCAPANAVMKRKHKIAMQGKGQARHWLVKKRKVSQSEMWVRKKRPMSNDV
ncbi:hypothetical protein BC567DRAFT_214711 [Phyllosticta citribraziliensis]